MTTLASSAISSEFSNSKIVCNKEDVILVKETCNNDNNYRIIFNINNPKFPIQSIVGLKLYTLLYELNRDVIQTFKIINETETTLETVTLFKSFGKEFGIAPKAMHTISYMQLEQGMCTFNGMDIQPDNVEHNGNGINYIPKKYQRIESTYSKLIVYFISLYELQFDFTFELKSDGDEMGQESQCPVYMENSVALMIKKMFCRLKMFIERMT